MFSKLENEITNYNVFLNISAKIPVGGGIDISVTGNDKLFTLQSSTRNIFPVNIDISIDDIASMEIRIRHSV